MNATAEAMTRTADLYPSRIAPEPAIVPRRDPVVHAEPGTDGPLSAEQIEGYRQNGFLFLERFFDAAEIAQVQSELDRLWEVHQDSDAREVIREPESEEVRSIFYVHKTSPVIAALAGSRKLAGAVEQILGRGLYIHQSRINFKPGYRGKEFYWHSDFETWHVEDGMPRMRALSVSIALTPNTPHNGPLMVIPGSHQHYVACVGETPDKHYESSLRRQEYGVPDDESLRWLVETGGGIEAAIGGVGSVVMFDCNTMHGSNSNITPDPRSNVFIVYNRLDNRLVEPFSDLEPRPEHIGSRDVTPLARH